MKKIVVAVLIILLGLSIWYLFIKKYDYEFTFQANLAQEGAYNQVKKIRFESYNSLNKNATVDNANFRQEVLFEEEEVILDWKLKSIKDTITKIKVGIISKDHSIQNRLQVLVGTSSLVKLIKEDLLNFRKILRDYTDSFKVIVDGETETPAMEILSVSSKTGRLGKAEEMMKLNSYLYPKLAENNISINGFPFIKIRNWDEENDLIYMDFGFPIEHKDSLPLNSKITHDKILSHKALKATYFGNYRNSDEAWYVLLEYARNNNISIQNKPLEIFYNNPMQGGSEIEWKAEIFLPIDDNE